MHTAVSGSRASVWSASRVPGLNQRVLNSKIPSHLFNATLSPGHAFAKNWRVREYPAFGAWTSGLNVATSKSGRATWTCLRGAIGEYMPRLLLVGHDTVFLIRSPITWGNVVRLAFSPNSPCRRPFALLSRPSESVGMALAAVSASEGHSLQIPSFLLKLFNYDDGPRQIGIGWIPPSLYVLLAALLAVLSVCTTLTTFVFFPQTLPWFLWASSLAFSTRPDIDSFLAWTRKEAPVIAAQKKLFVDKIRASFAPYMIAWFQRPALLDYGLFSIVTFTDHADYVYIYAGAFSRWVLLGWYNKHDNYNFDKICGVGIS